MIAENRPKRVERPTRKIIGSATVNCDLLNVRTQPVKTAPVYKEVKRGEKFNVTEGGNNDFTAIIVDDEVRYAMTHFLQVTKTE